MQENDAFYLLFTKDWGHGPLFKSQVELVYELLNTPASLYFIDKSKLEQYTKAVSRLKAYLSQLFSPLARRTVTTEFKRSLRLLLDKRTVNLVFDAGEVWEKVIKDLIEKNSVDLSEKDPENDEEFYNAISSAEYISIFTARMISFSFKFSDRSVSLIKVLIDDFIASFDKSPVKKYRFNLPSADSCKLLWRALRKEIGRYFNGNRQIASAILFRLTDMGELTEGAIDLNEESGEKLASVCLQLVAHESIIVVYFQRAPVYLTSSIVLNPYDHKTRAIYLFLQRSGESDQLHKLSDEESTIWNFFVWEKLKIQDADLAELIPYNDKW